MKLNSIIRIASALACASVLQVSAAKAETVLYSFAGGSDGAAPLAGLISVKGTLYGTTQAGGTGGTMFSLTTSGTERVVYTFKGGSDGADPDAGLINLNGTFYGTTSSGGNVVCGGCGTVFSITHGGTETVLHSFRGRDGSDPEGGLIDVSGTLYGTTQFGGKYDGGTVFSITPSGTEKVLHSFGNGNGNDGDEPRGSLINVNGTLYGATRFGGIYNGGTVFSITPSGREKVLYSLGGGFDGSSPVAGLLAGGGKLYGTTDQGGSFGRGTVFSVTLGGTETVLHSFDGGGGIGPSTDGANPEARLTAVHGILYGTTNAGGTGSCENRYGNSGCGTVFSITPSGTEKVLYSFQGGNDGNGPNDLKSFNGTLYGTTVNGGAHNQGTIFSITPQAR